MALSQCFWALDMFEKYSFMPKYHFKIALRLNKLEHVKGLE